MKLFEIKDINGPRPPDENFPYSEDRVTRNRDEEQYYPGLATKRQMTRIKKAEDLPNFKYMGSGVNAFVYKKDDPGNMDRVERISTPADATAYFLNKIADTPSVQNNPFLPRVLNTSRKISVHQHTLEPLQNFFSIPIISNADLMRGLFLRYFKGEGKDWIESVRNAKDTETIEKIEQEHFTYISGGHIGVGYAEEMLEILDIAIRTGDCTHVNDPQLCKAVQFITDITAEISNNNNNIISDLHPGNVMWRVNGMNIQLVIIDPIHDGRDS